MRSTHPQARDGLLGAAPLAALALLLANDHVWKWSHPGVVTGKLSDVAGLIFFPLLLQAAYEVALRRRWSRPSGRVLFAAIAATGVVFALVKTLPAAGWAYRHGLAAAQWPVRALSAALTDGALPAWRPVALAQDVSDLLTLPALALAWWAGQRRGRRAAQGLPESVPVGERRALAGRPTTRKIV